MSTGDLPESVGFPQPGREVAWLGFYLRVEFYPHIKITRKGGNEFAAAINAAIEAGTTTTVENEWIIRGAGAYDGMQVVVTKDTIQLSVTIPSNAQDWYEQRFASILETFTEIYEPKVVLSTSAMANGLLDVTGDARAFLGGAIMVMHPKQLAPIARPLEVLGLRLYFPAFQEDEEHTTDWGVNVRIESCIDDSEKLYLEADADWDETVSWQDETAGALASNIKTVTDFINDRVLSFLHQDPRTRFDEDLLDGDEGQDEQEDEDEDNDKHEDD